MNLSPHHDSTPLFQSHSRDFETNRYVYPVLSRRSRGISIGVNLSQDKRCNFDCIYCQVDRTETGRQEPLDAPRLADELDHAIGLVTSGRLFEMPKFAVVPPEMRRLNDIALSGDGEPTLCPDFTKAVEICADARRRHRLDDVKLVLITNATLFDRDAVRRGLDLLDANGGEIWAKLDAGTVDYYRQVNRSKIPFARILENLAMVSAHRPIIIQTLFSRIHGHAPSEDELAAYCGRLSRLVASGGRIKAVQILTVARQPAEPWVTALDKEEMDALGRRVSDATKLFVEIYYG